MKTERLRAFSATKSKEKSVQSCRGGSLRPPVRELNFAFGFGDKQNYGFHNRRKFFSFRTLLGRALKPRPYDCKVYLFSSAAALRETRLYRI